MIQCRCKFCDAWFIESQMATHNGHKVCPICRSNEGIIKIEKEEMNGDENNG